MIVIIPPAKTFEFSPTNESIELTNPIFYEQTEELIRQLKTFSVEELGKLMKMSNALAEINFKRNQTFFENETHPAILSFHGAMYKGMEVGTYTKEEFEYVQQNVRILSGLYGMLRPLDKIEAYRLEMGTTLANSKGPNLYAFWKDILTEAMLKELDICDGDKALINVSSTEYSKALDLKMIEKSYPIVTVTFKERKGDTYKLIGTYAKRARGLMIQYLAKHKVNRIEEIKSFDYEGYCFHEGLSSEKELVFTRD